MRVRRMLRRGVRRRARDAALIDGALRVDVDAICPDCLAWIGPDEHVRRNVYGLVEHDVCPPVRARQQQG
jgi:hypothetical protein